MHINIQGGVTEKINNINLFSPEKATNGVFVISNEYWLNSGNINILSTSNGYKLVDYYVTENN